MPIGGSNSTINQTV